MYWIFIRCDKRKTDLSDWKNRLEKLQDIDWDGTNNTLLEGRALVSGRLNKSRKNVTLTANVIKKVLGLQLDPNETAVEEDYVGNDDSTDGSTNSLSNQ